MLVRHLAYFVTLAREKHFARAAEACNVAQPTLSAAIRKLEEDLDARLVVRGQRYIGLTPDGEKALAWGQLILADYGSMRDALSGKVGLSGVLRLGVIPAAMPAVAFLTARFRAANPGATVEIRSLTSRAIQLALDAFELDGGLTYLDNEPLERVLRVPLYRERYVFICRREHRFAEAASLDWRAIVDEPLCLLSEDMQNRRILDAVARSVGIQIAPKVVSNSYLGVCAHLREGSLSGVVPHTFAFVFGRDPDLVSVPLVEPVENHALGLVLSDRDPLSPMAAALKAAAAEVDVEAAFLAAGY